MVFLKIIKSSFWITKAADQGLMSAKFDLEVINTYGKSVNQNHEVPRNQEWINEGYKDFKK